MLVTGGSGYLGGWVSRLAATTWEVTATYATHATPEPGVRWRRLDVRDPEAVTTLVDEIQPDTIVHTAAVNPGQGDDFLAVNVTGARTVAAAAASVDAHLIHISTDLVFDGKDGAYTEADPVNPLTAYGSSKARGELEVLASGARATIVRTSLIYGWKPTVARSLQWMLDTIARGETLRLWSDELRCPIWVESLAAAVVELAGTDPAGFIHVAGAQAISRYEFGVRLLRHHGLDPGSAIATPSPPGTNRPLNCTLDISLARHLLRTPLPGVDEVLAAG
jgi:dTDP-4-dehydrorhamnose reductase